MVCTGQIKYIFQKAESKCKDHEKQTHQLTSVKCHEKNQSSSNIILITEAVYRLNTLEKKTNCIKVINRKDYTGSKETLDAKSLSIL